MRVAICDRHPYARLGIRAALGADPHIEVAGEASDYLGLVALTARTEVDVLVLEAQPQDSEKLADLAAAMVILVEDVQTAADWVSFTQANVCAVVHHAAPGPELVEAVRRSWGGGGYVSPALGGALLALIRARLPRSGSLVPTHKPLTSREAEVLKLVRQGLANKEIARRLGLSEKTVKFHVSNVLSKSHMPNRGHLIASGR